MLDEGLAAWHVDHAQPPPQYVLALAWRRGEPAAAAHRFLAFLRCYRDRHQWITGPQAAPPGTPP